MDEAKYLKCGCQHCAGHIEFPAEAAGAVVSCPHCGQKTELLVATSQDTGEAAVEKRAAVGWIILAMIVVVTGVAGGFVYRKSGKTQTAVTRRATNAVAKPRAAAASKPGFFITNRLAIGAITLEKASNSSVVYALGRIENESDDQRFGLKLELDLLDGSGEKIGTATDYLSILDPRKEWSFRALVLEKKAVGARFASIREDQ